jgi:hypothetical protein
MLNYKGGIISTSFTVQVDAPLPIIDQDLKTIAVKTYPNPAGEVTFVSIITDNPQNMKLRLYDIFDRMIGNKRARRRKYYNIRFKSFTVGSLFIL